MMMDGHMTPFGWIFMLVFWVLVIAVIVIAVMWLFGQRKTGGEPPEKTPLDIAKERYARGEISREEFENLKRDLE